MAEPVESITIEELKDGSSITNELIKENASIQVKNSKDDLPCQSRIFKSSTINNKLFFGCKLCADVFGSKRILNRHLSLVHNNMENAGTEDRVRLPNNKIVKAIVIKLEPPDIYSNSTNSECSKSDSEGPEPFDMLVTCEDSVKIESTSLPETNKNTFESNDSDESNKDKCPICNKAFKNMHIHMGKIHPEVRLYSCGICDKRFKSNHTLKLHMAAHSEKRPFLCEICNKRFKTITDLTKHARTHSGERPYSCETCGKSFSVSGSLRNHLRTHTDDRPFTCDLCDKMFKSSSNLKNHMRIHTGEEAFSCKLCDERFKTCYKLKIHVKNHSNDPVSSDC